LDVDDLFKANLPALKAVFKLFDKKYLSLPHTLQLFQKDTPLALSDKEITYHYAMSKSTILNDVG
jgi:hypothetical protein